MKNSFQNYKKSNSNRNLKKKIRIRIDIACRSGSEFESILYFDPQPCYIVIVVNVVTIATFLYVKGFGLNRIFGIPILL